MKLRATNHDIARAFFEIGELLSLEQANSFRIRAYERGGAVVEGYPEELGRVYERGGLPALREIPGIGDDLASKIEEMVRTGRLQALRDLEKKTPKGLRDILRVEGMGPVRTAFLWKKFKVKNLTGLARLMKSGKLLRVRGWGEKSVQNVLRGLELLKTVGTRIPLPVAYHIAESIKATLLESGLCREVEVAGSLRRMKDTVGDIDILVTSDSPDQVLDLFTGLSLVDQVLAKGGGRSTVILKAGIQADIRVLSKDQFGAGLYYFTGSKDHNVVVREHAVKAGMTVSEFGVYRGTKEKKGKLLASKTEKEVFESLGMSYIPPELRENRGEIELARKGKLPVLITEKDLCGDLHVHTTISDGVDDMASMALAARKAGLEYIAITDHASSMGMVRGIKETTVGDYLKKIEAVQRNVPGIHIISGTEVDILENGRLYLSNAALRRLEWVVASVHSMFRQSEEEMTRRLLYAIENPYVSMIGHPTTRLISKRAPVAFNSSVVFKAATTAGVALEVSASPFRLDLDDVHAREAKKIGAKLVVASDAHGKDQFDFRFGIGQARRGWLTKKDVLNTMPWEAFKKHLIQMRRR